jgi:hypothetical protein
MSSFINITPSPGQFVPLGTYKKAAPFASDFPSVSYAYRAKGGHELICGSPGSVPVSQLDYFGLTQICGNTCAQVPMSILI